MVWALLHALFALGDLKDANEITTDHALAQFERLLDAGRFA
jgi:hypothetical protein